MWVEGLRDALARDDAHAFSVALAGFDAVHDTEVRDAVRRVAVDLQTALEQFREDLRLADIAGRQVPDARHGWRTCSSSPTMRRTAPSTWSRSPARWPMRRRASRPPARARLRVAGLRRCRTAGIPGADGGPHGQRPQQPSKC
ncbi:MAG: hypothetical protein U1F06_00250 [Steroidobacteraceae bacterium]